MKTSSKSIWAIACIIVITACSATPFIKDGKPFEVKEFTLDGSGDLRVRTSGGSISVSAQESNKVRVEMYVRKGGRWVTKDDSDARELMEDFEIQISQSGSTVIASAERKSSFQSWFGGDHASISFTVYVPKTMSCNLNTSGGSISLTGVSGEQELKTSGGSLSLSMIRGNVEAGTSGGSINIERYSGRLDAHTSGGSINLKEAKGDLNVRTSGGSINLDNISGSVEASTSGGGIHANITGLERYLRLKTSGGSITASIPSGLGLDLDLKGNRVNTKLVNFNGEAEKDRIRGSMNGGGIEVYMATSGGSVELQYQ
jgi:DUF4097 and DUF4098 domain-containing protein YvlB